MKRLQETSPKENQSEDSSKKNNERLSKILEKLDLEGNRIMD